MADIDEDAPPPNGAAGVEVDLSEEAQDFRFLSNLTGSGSQRKLPKRGEKDFEPDATQMQSSVLEASRAAMSDALSYTRIHRGKSRTKAILDYEGCGALVEKAHDRHFMTMGKWKEGKLWLAPEEALYLLERGSLDIQWPPELLREEGDASAGLGDSGEEDTVPMSLQAAYSIFIGMGQTLPCPFTLEMYQVYANLKRLGYTVIRATSATNAGAQSVDGDPTAKTTLFSFLAQRRSRVLDEAPGQRGATGPLVAPGLYRSYNDVFRLLRIIPSHNPTAEPATPPATPYFEPDSTADPTEGLRITFHVYKPSSNYAKRSPPPPDYRISVMAARDTSVPSLAHLSSLLASTPYHRPLPTAPLYQRLKTGYRNVILAVVDSGIVSYLNVSDAGFAMEEIRWLPGRTGPFRKSGNRRGRHRAQPKGQPKA